VRSTTDILAAIESRLTALQWTPSDAPAQPAFGAVHRYDTTRLEEAFEELTISKVRVAVAVYTGATWEREWQGSAVKAVRVTSITVLVSDRALGKRAQALEGGAGNPGVHLLRELVSANLVGRLIDAPEAIDVLPVSEDLLEIRKESLPGRVVGAVELECRGGWLTARVGPGPAR
jgi:hypothetical protein